MKKVISILLLAILAIGVTAHAEVVIPNGVYYIHPSESRYFSLDNHFSRTVDGNNINLYENNGTDAQKWLVENYKGGILIRLAANPNFVIDNSGNNIKNGNNIHLWSFNGCPAQIWHPDKQDENKFILRNDLNPGYVLDLEEGRIHNETNIFLYELHLSSNQEWIFEPVDASLPSDPKGKDTLPLTFSAFADPYLLHNNWQDDAVDLNFAQRAHVIRPLDNLEKTLLDNGFQRISKRDVTEYSDYDEEYFTYTVAQYAKAINYGTVTVDYEPSEIKITFPHSAARDAFMASVKSHHYRLFGDSYQIWGAEQYYWTGVKLKTQGNTVRIIAGAGL